MLQTVSKLRIAIGALTILALGFIGARCTMAKSQVLEFEDMAQYNLQLNPKTKIPEKISGLCFRSMYCVSEITTTTNRATLVILVRIGFCKEGQSGSFSYPLKISDDVKELRFGEKEHLLWKRDGEPR